LPTERCSRSAWRCLLRVPRSALSKRCYLLTRVVSRCSQLNVYGSGEEPSAILPFFFQNPMLHLFFVAGMARPFPSHFRHFPLRRKFDLLGRWETKSPRFALAPERLPLSILPFDFSLRSLPRRGHPAGVSPVFALPSQVVTLSVQPANSDSTKLLSEDASCPVFQGPPGPCGGALFLLSVLTLLPFEGKESQGLPLDSLSPRFRCGALSSFLRQRIVEEYRCRTRIFFVVLPLPLSRISVLT